MSLFIVLYFNLTGIDRKNILMLKAIMRFFTNKFEDIWRFIRPLKNN